MTVDMLTVVFLALFSSLAPSQRQPINPPFGLVLSTEQATATLGSDGWVKVRWTNTSNQALDASANILDAENVTPDEARQMVIEGINYTAYHETNSALHDSDKNCLFGPDHYKSGRLVVKPSPWAEGDFEEEMAMLLVCANVLNRSVPAFANAQVLLEGGESVIGRVIQRAKHRGTDTVAG